VDSRTIMEGHEIRRRRECPACGQRFTTYERVENALPMVVKRSGARSSFDSRKVRQSINLAGKKRDIPPKKIEEFLKILEAKLSGSGRSEVSSVEIGDQVLEFLRRWDMIAYIRYASVFKDCKDAQEFIGLIQSCQPDRPS
jgi:transcriptional repressor NrdR